MGEHALCLAAATSDQVPPQPERNAPSPADHSEHHSLGCCLWHAAAGGFMLPHVGAVLRLTFAEAATLAPTAAPPTPTQNTSPVQARAPPLRS
jgi:hypothetical protein